MNGAVATHLLAAIEKELVRVNPITDGATDKGEPVENNGWLIRAFKQELSQDVENHGHGDQGRQPDDAERPYRLSRAVFADLVEDLCENAHGGAITTEGKRAKMRPEMAKGDP